MAESSLHFTSMSACARSATGVTQSCAGLPRGVRRSAPRGSAHRSRDRETERPIGRLGFGVTVQLCSQSRET